MATQAYPLDAATRRDAQEWAVEYFVQNYDPYWRAVLIEGLLTLMRDRPRLAAAAESASGIGFGQDEQYVHGTAARGLVAAGVNELAMQCEDLFSLIRAVHSRDEFAHEVVSYKPGKAIALAGPLADREDAWVRKALLVPDADKIARGLAEAEQPVESIAIAEQAAARLTAWCREAARWYLRHEASHLRYKHGLRLLLGGFGPLSPALINERRGSTSAALISFTNAPVTDETTPVMFQAPDRLRGHLAALFECRLLIRVQFAPGDVDLVEVAALAWRIAEIQACVLANRVAIDTGPGPDGDLAVRLPHENARQRLTVLVRPDHPPSLADFRLR